MHHLRLTLNGPAHDLERMARELEARGATRLEGREPLCLVWSTDTPVLDDLAARHPRVAVGVQRFEALGDELVSTLVQGASVSIVEVTPIMPEREGQALSEWGLWDDEGGAPLDPALVRTAAERVGALPAPVRPSSPIGGVLSLGRALGRLCETMPDPFDEHAPGPDTIAAVLHLASIALTLGAERDSMSPAEAVVARSWFLSKAHLHAGAQILWESPGAASWPEWLSTLLVSTSDVMDAAWHCLHRAPPDVSSVGSEHWSSSEEQFAAAALCLLSTCLQVLVLFDVGGDSHETPASPIAPSDSR